MRPINKIIIHCTASTFGDKNLITKWHIEKGFETIGYHFVILNGNRSKNTFNKNEDGIIETGRDISIAGAHCKDDNASSIGICLVGDKDFTPAQFATLKNLLIELMQKYNISIERVIGHNETITGVAQGKTCPNFSVEKIRQEFKVR